MKLRNKKTGEIIETDFDLSISIPDDEKLYGCDTYTQLKGYTSIAELNEDWEDSEKQHYCYITDSGCIKTREVYLNENLADEFRKEIGNYFKIEEEAEKAVEKLKAWKRLKDKGISFELKVIESKWYLEPKANPQQRTIGESQELFEDIMFVFGGEE